MTENLGVILAVVGAGIGSGGLSCALIIHLLKDKVSQSEATIYRTAIHEKIDAGLELATNRHKENKAMMKENSKHIRVIRESIGYVIAKQAGKPRKAIKKMHGYNDMNESMVVESLLEKLNGD